MKRALVTGGSGAIGAAICLELARQGLHVVVHTHRHPETARAIVEEIVRAGGSASVTHFDVTDGEAARHTLKACLLYTSPSPRDRTRSRMPSSA